MKRALILLLVFGFVLTLGGCQKAEGDKTSTIAENEKLKVQNAQLQESIEELHRDMNKLAEERNEWRDKCYDSQVEFEELKSLVETLKGKSSELQAKLDEVQKNKDKLEDEMQGLVKKLSSIEGVKVSKVGNEILLTVDNKILFASGQAELIGASTKAIKAIAEVLTRDFKGRQIRVEGHTDSDKIKATSTKFQTNWELSTARASNVLHALVKMGVDESKCSVAGFAYFRPVAPNDSDEGKAKNRRVEIYILPVEK